MNLREKYRPTTIGELVGCKVFREAAATWSVDNCPSNLLFVGPPGVGKTSAAISLAKDMLGEFFDPMNFVVTNASDDRGIEYVRELKRISKQKAIGVGRRIIFLDEADSFTTPAQKALKQIMEDSHKSAIFILAANDISPIHAAIRDRCLTFEFKPVTDDSAVQRLNQVIEAEGMPVNWKEHVASLLKLCNGSLRSAIDILEGLPSRDEALLEHLKRDTNSLRHVGHAVAG